MTGIAELSVVHALLLTRKVHIMSTTLVRRSVPTYRSWLRRLRESAEHGMSTAEYAIGTIGAVALAGIIVWFAKEGPGKNLVTQIFQNALTNNN